MLNNTIGISLFVAYSILILLIVWLTKKTQSSEDFLVMKRSLGVFQGSVSMAVSWIWAPAIFICSMQAYNQGIPGIFWFTFPNILTFFVFVPFAIALRKKFPNGYTISQVFKLRFNDSRAHSASLVISFGYQLGAIIINCVAGATLLSLLSGIPYHLGVILMGSLALSYSLISGLRASVMSDVIQMALVVFIALIIVPWAIYEIGGLSILADGIGGFSGKYNNLFDSEVAYTFGIATTIGLISGPVADQMFSQRAFAARKDSISRIFIYAGLLFGIVPIILSALGFIGASAVQSNLFQVNDPQMVGPIVIQNLLPHWVLGMFAIMAFAGLTSTLDSAFTAVGSLTAVDLFKSKSEDSKIKIARRGMILVGILGVSISLLQPKLLWVFLIYGALASSIFFPAFLMLFWKKVTSSGVFWGILSGLAIGTPLSIFANIFQNTHLIVLSSILGLLVGGIVCVLTSISTPKSNE